MKFVDEKAEEPVSPPKKSKKDGKTREPRAFVFNTPKKQLEIEDTTSVRTADNTEQILSEASSPKWSAEQNETDKD